MTQAIALEAANVPAFLRGDYSGRKFQVIVGETMTIPADAGLWDGGSRDLFYAVRMADGASMRFPGQDLWIEGRMAHKVEIPAGACVVRHTIFCGNDLGLTFYVRPDSVAGLIPADDGLDLSREEKIILLATVGLVASYRRDACAREGINASMFDRLREKLAGFGLLDSRGAATVKGKNVANSLPRMAGF